MFAGICVGGWDRGVGEVVVFSMGTRLLTAAGEPTGKLRDDVFRDDASRTDNNDVPTHLP